MIRVGIIGASGYTGGELVRILLNHPDVEIACISSRSYAGKPFFEVFPSMYKVTALVFENLAPEAVGKGSDVVFTAVPHGVAMEAALALLGAGARVIDLGADFRLEDAAAYREWYGRDHVCPELLSEAAYGLPELHREEIRAARVVGNPGCYPTASILGASPLLAHGLVDPDTLIIDAKSGVSGAGRSPGEMYHFPECNDNLRPYGLPRHRHTPEIEQELGRIAGRSLHISFVPHLVPMTRGIIATIYASLIRPIPAGELVGLYREFYRDEPFVRILPEGRLPQALAVRGSNYCDIGIAVDERTHRVIAVSAIDNLVKGASGQAVQNMNIMFGVPETEGLEGSSLFP